MKIKIARIITRMDLGGAQQAVLYLSRHLNQETFEQIVITGEGGLLSSELSSLSCIKHYEIPDLTRRVGLLGALADIRAIIKIRNILTREKPQITHTHTPKAGILGRWAAWLAGIPRIVHTYHGLGFSDFHPFWKKWLFIWLERMTAKITTLFVVVSERNRVKAERYGIFSKGKCDLIRSGVDLQDFGRLASDKFQKRLALDLAPADRIVGIVAGFKPPKALHYFVDVAKTVSDRIPGVKFLMVGDGELRPQLEAQIHELELESVVKMIGWRRDIPELLQVFDIFLLTSLWEGLPRVLVEAMLVGIPVVATDVDGIAEVVKNGENGYLVSPGDTDKMAEKVINLLRDECLRIRMGCKARSMVKEFSAQKMLEDYTRLYQNIMNPLGDLPS
jgi:glycosyltransferase involved in cell wall biosynthesis